MPELPEVEVLKRGLQILLGERVCQVVFLPSKVVKSDLNILVGKEIIGVVRRGRYLKVIFDRALVLILHLGMTGSIRVRSVYDTSVLERHEFFRIRCESGFQFGFLDYRRFGKVFLENEFISWEDKLGIEPLSNDLTAKYWFDRARSKHLPLKLFLMDNKIVTGIGNIYANEILFAAKQHPERPAWTVSLVEWQIIVKKTKDILNLAIKCGGSSVKDYVNLDGKAGEFQNFLKVYGRKGQLCLVCNNKLSVIKQGGRSTFFCERCQGY